MLDHHHVHKRKPRVKKRLGRVTIVKDLVCITRTTLVVHVLLVECSHIEMLQICWPRECYLCCTVCYWGTQLQGGRYDLWTVCSILCSLKLGYGHPSESHHDRLQIHVAHPQICRSFLDDTEDLTHVALTRLWKICEAVHAPEACLCGDIRDHFVTYSSTFCLCLLSKKWLPTNYHSTTVCLECNIGLCAHCFDPFYDNQ